MWWAYTSFISLANLKSTVAGENETTDASISFFASTTDKQKERLVAITLMEGSFIP